MKIRDLLPLAGAAPLALLLLGCPFDPPHEPPDPPAKIPVLPENVLSNLITSYKNRDIAQFDSLLYDAQAAGTDEGYSFRFWSDDVRRDPNIPPSWGRDEEILSAGKMFSSLDVERIEIMSLAHTDPYYDNTVGHEGQQIIYVTNASLEVVQRMTGQPEPTIWRVDSNLARFRFKVQYVSAKGDSMWRIIEWEDLGGGAAKGEQAEDLGTGRSAVARKE